MVPRIHNGTSYPPPPSRSGSAAKLRLLFIGNIWHKGGSRLVGIAKALQRRGVNFQLTVIADQVSWLQRRFARVGLQDHVNVMARQSKTDLWRTYAAHDLLLMLSAGEPFGMVTIEAMGMGCVPVAYDVPSGTREIIEPALSGLLVRLNSDAVAAAIAALSPAQLSAMSAAAARRSRTLFCAERPAQEYLQLADDLVRCRDLVHRARLPAPVAPLIASSRSYSPIARLYHALPAALRHQIRNALTAYPASFRWLREKSEAGLKPYPAEFERNRALDDVPRQPGQICRESAAARARRRRRARTGGARGHHNAGHGLRLTPDTA